VAFPVTGFNLNRCMMNAEAMFRFVRGLRQEQVINFRARAHEMHCQWVSVVLIAQI
jgi:hypothetical protein